METEDNNVYSNIMPRVSNYFGSLLFIIRTCNCLLSTSADLARWKLEFVSPHNQILDLLPPE